MERTGKIGIMVTTLSRVSTEIPTPLAAGVEAVWTASFGGNEVPSVEMGAELPLPLLFLGCRPQDPMSVLSAAVSLGTWVSRRRPIMRRTG